MATSSDYEILWLGYNDRTNFDRIWGWLKMSDGRQFAFYGKRGKNMNFKLHSDKGQYYWGGSAENLLKNTLMATKHKGFKEITPADYERLVPTFREDLEVGLTAAILADDLD